MTAAAATGPTLLVVDDDDANRKALTDVLAAHGYATQGLRSGRLALEAMAATRYDLLLTDLRMPGMDGMQLLRAALAFDPSIVVVMMTGHGSVATAVEAMQAGALDYILKPFKLSTALPVLARALKVRELRRRNAALEAQVHRQLQDLVAANGDLDAFSYSVSHDLRAPLQVIDGFSAILESAHAAQLDEKGRHYLGRIRAGVGRMSELVDGLLRLSRLSRQPLQRETVDVAGLVRGVIDDMREMQVPGVDAIACDAGLPSADADPVLLRQVFANLLSNACKFSSKAANPRVQVGCRSVHGCNVYFVSDNGAGFDMSQAGDMFQPFHRMHSARDYPGMGVGLSIVARIVHRHGGGIRAVASPGQGACFNFTLAPEPAADLADDTVH